MLLAIRSLALLIVTTLSVAIVSAEDNPPLLTIGSPAPELQVEHWLGTGDGQFQPVTKFEPGKVYLVEFWATWCGPCIGSMPHLAELQEMYRDQGVQIISISDETPNEIAEFLKLPVPVAEGAKEQTYAELTQGCCLTTDPDRSVYRDYMDAAGQRGIPRAYLVGKSGEIEWIGHPMSGLDKVLNEILDGTWDRATFLAEFKPWQTIGVMETRVTKLVRAGEFAAAQELFAREKLDLMEQFRGTPDILEHLREYEVDLAEEILLAPAIDAYQVRNYEKCAEELEKVVASANRHQRTRIHHIWFDSEMKLKRYDRAENILNAAKTDAATKTEAAIEDLYSINVLNGMCWKTYEEVVKPESTIPAALKAAALSGAERAVELAPEDNPILDTLAHLVCVSGDLDRAIKLEAQAYDRETDAEIKNQFRRELEAMKGQKAAVMK